MKFIPVQDDDQGGGGVKFFSRKFYDERGEGGSEIPPNFRKDDDGNWGECSLCFFEGYPPIINYEENRRSEAGDGDCDIAFLHEEEILEARHTEF